VLKDLEKQKQILNSYRGNPAISEGVAGRHLATGRLLFRAQQQPGKAGQSLTENDWLMSIRSRVRIPGGTCEFDLPAYYAWQHRSRPRGAPTWSAGPTSLAPDGRVARTLLLQLLRDSGKPQKVMATGAVSANLPQGRTFQLLRLRIDESLGLMPEISGNRLMVSVRLMRQEADDRLHAAPKTHAFELTFAREQSCPSEVPRIVRCPGLQAAPACMRLSNPYRPFCCERCKSMDLGAWANEEFRCAAAPPEDATPREPPGLQIESAQPSPIRRAIKYVVA
jgi:cell division protein ZapD